MTSQHPSQTVVYSLAAACLIVLLVNDAVAWTTPEEAAKNLRVKKVVAIGESLGNAKTNERFYRSVKFKRDWVIEPKDWLYVPSLAREIEGTPYVKGKRHPLSISIDGPVEADTLAECFENMREVKASPFDVFILEASLNRRALLVLGSYPGLTGLAANESSEEITDEDWAKCIAAWPNATDLFLGPRAGRKAIAEASKLEHLMILKFRNADLTEVDLVPLHKNMKLQVLWVFAVDACIEYLNQKGTGKWQLDKARRTVD